jgi:hypothetical protein
VTFGLLSFAGEAGVVASALGAAGAVESSTYVTPLEHADVLPAASVAVVLNVVVESFATAAARPGEENDAAEPLAAGAPEQSEVV